MTSTSQYYWSANPTSTPTPLGVVIGTGPTSTATSIPLPTPTGNQVGDASDTVSTVGDPGQEMHWWHIPGIVGVFIDGYSQYRRDRDQGYPFLELNGRMTVVIIEGQLVSITAAAFAGAAGTALLEDPAIAPIGAGTVFIVASITGSNIANQLNEKVIFPRIQKLTAQ